MQLTGNSFPGEHAWLLLPKGGVSVYPDVGRGKVSSLRNFSVSRSLKSQGVAEGAGMVNHVLLHEWVQSHYKGLVENELL